MTQELAILLIRFLFLTQYRKLIRFSLIRKNNIIKIKRNRIIKIYLFANLFAIPVNEWRDVCHSEFKFNLVIDLDLKNAFNFHDKTI